MSLNTQEGTLVFDSHSGVPMGPSLKAKLGAELALELVADKWFVLIVHQLKHGRRRYNELKRDIPGISQRMLTHTLRNMQRDGLVNRVVYPVVPPKTEYSLTPLGMTLTDLPPSIEQNCGIQVSDLVRVGLRRGSFSV